MAEAAPNKTFLSSMRQAMTRRRKTSAPAMMSSPPISMDTTSGTYLGRRRMSEISTLKGSPSVAQTVSRKQQSCHCFTNNILEQSAKIGNMTINQRPSPAGRSRFRRHSETEMRAANIRDQFRNAAHLSVPPPVPPRSPISLAQYHRDKLMKTTSAPQSQHRRNPLYLHPDDVNRRTTVVPEIETSLTERSPPFAEHIEKFTVRDESGNLQWRNFTENPVSGKGTVIIPP